MDKHLKFIKMKKFILYAILMFVILYLTFLLQGISQGGDYNIYGESLGFSLFIYPANHFDDFDLWLH